jgi:hypothetical protein
VGAAASSGDLGLRLVEQSSLRERLPVRLKACLIGEVEVLFRYTLSGL